MSVPKKLPVLMYHKISEMAKDDLTVSISNFESQLTYLNSQGYTPIWCMDVVNFIEQHSPLPEKPIVISFDDGYQNSYDLAYPLLQRFGFKATIFLPVKFVGQTNIWDGGDEQLMTYETMRGMTSLVEFGLHSYGHLNYRTLSLDNITYDVEQCISTLERENFPYSPVFAYPYGGLPKDETIKTELKKLFHAHGIKLAVRIKGETNALPLNDVYEVKRIGVSGIDSLARFKLKLWTGKARLF